VKSCNNQMCSCHTVKGNECIAGEQMYDSCQFKMLNREDLIELVDEQIRAQELAVEKYLLIGYDPYITGSIARLMWLYQIKEGL